MLAGGLGPENVRDAIDAVRPWAVDASSSLESDAGRQGSHDARPRLRGGGASDAADLRRVRRPLRARDADPGARRARGRLARGARRRRRSAASSHELATTYAGRPTPLTLARSASRPASGSTSSARTSLHTGAHKLNNALGQVAARAAARQAADRRRDRRRPARRRDRDRLRALRARRASSTWAPRTCAGSGRTSSGCGCSAPRCAPVEFGTQTLKEATSEAIRDWIANVETTHYLIGSCVGPAPYPEHRARAAGGDRREAREQLLDAEGRLPEVVVACVGGGSNAIGMFARLRRRRGRAARSASRRPARRASAPGAAGVLHGARSSVLADEDGQMLDAHSISAGLDYPGVGPEHAVPARLAAAPSTSPRPTRRRSPRSTGSRETEGILPALEPAHALARALDLDEELMLVCLSGRGDKDLEEVLALAMHDFEPTHFHTSRSARTEPVLRVGERRHGPHLVRSTPAGYDRHGSAHHRRRQPADRAVLRAKAPRRATRCAVRSRPDPAQSRARGDRRPSSRPTSSIPAFVPGARAQDGPARTGGRSTSSAGTATGSKPRRRLESLRAAAARPDGRLLRRRAAARAGDLVRDLRRRTAATWTTAASARASPVYFPVFAEARALPRRRRPRAQGDGEIVGTGIEVSMDVEFTLEVLEGQDDLAGRARGRELP